MSISKRKRRKILYEQQSAKRFYLIVGIATIMLILLMYLVYRSVA